MRGCLWGSSGAILCVSGSDVEMETLALLILPFKVDPQLTDRQSVQIFISRVSRDLISRHVCRNSQRNEFNQGLPLNISVNDLFVQYQKELLTPIEEATIRLCYCFNRAAGLDYY